MVSKIRTEGEARIVAQAIRDGKLSGQKKEEALKDLKTFDKHKGAISVINQLDVAAKGFNVGALAKVAGAPVDLANAALAAVDFGLEIVGVPEDFIQVSEEPVGGSRNIQRLLAATGTGYADIKDLPEDLRPIARGAETVGETVGMAAPVFGVASRMTPAKIAMQSVPSGSVARDLARGVVRTTAQSPTKIAAIEGASALGAGVGRGTAEALSPDDEFTGMAGELLGGIMAPMPVARAGIEKALDLAQGYTKAGRNRAAQQKVREILQEGGILTKDAEVDDRTMSSLIKNLEDAPSGLTTAQVVEDPKTRKVFTAIENKLIDDADEKFRNAIKTQNKNSIDAFNKQVKKLNNSSNPLVVKEGQKLRIELLNKNLDKKVEDAEGKMASAINKVLTKNKDDHVRASQEARAIIDDELQIARKMEKRLWDEVDKNVPSPTQNTISAFNSIKDEISPNEQVMKPLESFVQGLIKRKDTTLSQRPGRGFMATAQRQGFQPVVRVSAKELFRKRSVALRLARQARATGRDNDARLLNKLADGMLKDLNQVTNESANVANDFSRKLNEKFNTKLIRDLRNADTGVFLEKAGVGSDAQRAANFQALKRATQREIDTMETARTTETLNKLQRDFMESAAASVVNPYTNQVVPQRLSNFIRENQLTLREVGMLDDINDVDKQVKLANTLRDTASKGKAFVEKKSLAAQIAKGSDDLSEVVTRALDSNYQKDAFKDLITTVKRSKNQDALEGLRHGVFDQILNRATVSKGELGDFISGQKLQEILDTTVGDSTLRKNLLDSGLITPQQNKNLDTLSEKLKIFEEALDDPTKLDTLISTGDGLINTFARVVGSKVGGRAGLGRIMGGSTLIAQSAFAKAAVKYLEKVPALKVQGVLTQAIQDPKFMAELLRLGPKPQKQVETRINAYLLQQGLTGPTEIIDKQNQD